MEISRVDSLNHHDELADRYPILTKHWGLPPSDEPPDHIRDLPPVPLPEVRI